MAKQQKLQLFFEGSTKQQGAELEIQVNATGKRLLNTILRRFGIVFPKT